MRVQVQYGYDRDDDGRELHPDRAREIVALLCGDLLPGEGERDGAGEHPGHRASRRIASGQFTSEDVAGFSDLVDVLAERRRRRIGEVREEGARLATDATSRSAYSHLAAAMEEGRRHALAMRDEFVAAFEAGRIPGY